jgi:hypothetical protein
VDIPRKLSHNAVIDIKPLEKLLRHLLIAFMILGFLVAAFALSGCGSNAYDSGTDESSEEACRYAVSKALDEERYDDVIAYSCAHDMDRAAAYIGKAGYDVNDMIASMINANSAQSGNSIDAYLNDLVRTVTTDYLINLYEASNAYNMVNATEIT